MNIIIPLVGLLIGVSIGYGLFRYVIKGMYKTRLEEAEHEAEVVKEKKLLEVKEKFLNKKSELEKEVQQRNSKIQQVENKLKQRELGLNQRQEEINRKKKELDDSKEKLESQQKALVNREIELDRMHKQEQLKLEELSGLSAEEAKSRLVESLKDEARTNAQQYINDIMDDAKLTANKEAKRIVIQTIQRVATETAIENSVTVFHIDNDEVKRIVDFVKNQQEVEYDEAMMPSENTTSAGGSEPEDELFYEVIELLKEQETISTSYLQRRFRIGFNRAARMIDELEARGYVGPADGSKGRKVNVHVFNENDASEPGETNA